MVVTVSAPANIAVIKYMGKLDSVQNRPTNSSLSLTLDELCTYVRVTLRRDGVRKDEWRAIPAGPLPVVDGRTIEILPLELSEKSVARFLQHFANLKQRWGVENFFVVESGNNFPSDCGLASSASSFAALTKAAAQIFQQISPKNEPVSASELAELSRLGSGSSCRSFFGPWALWHSEGVRPMEFPFANLLHQVVVVESGKKAVSSSEAHRRVTTSALFNGRPQRAEKRLAELIQAFGAKDWSAAYQLCWAEFWDMHALFETSQPAFGYMGADTHRVLHYLRELWTVGGDGPIVTMDAGANVHLIWRGDQESVAKKVVADLGRDYRVFSNRKGLGSAL